MGRRDHRRGHHHPDGRDDRESKATKITLYRPLPGVPMFLDNHSMPPLKEWVPYLIGCEPIYQLGYGNATLITLEDGSQNVFGRGVPWVQKSINRHYAVDEIEIRRKYQDYTNMSQSVPIVVPLRKRVLFSVKTRIPQHHNDGATGYVADTAVVNIELISHDKTRIHLNTGQHIDVLMSTHAVRNRKRNAELFACLLHRDGLM